MAEGSTKGKGAPPISGVAEWFVMLLAVVMLSSATKEGMAEGSTKDKGTPPRSGVAG
jgi:hypothetical protein